MNTSKAIKLPESKRPFFSRFRVPFASVSSVEEYFALPSKEREWNGLYMLPYALPSELFGQFPGWETFYQKIKTLYPIQYFFRNWLFTIDNPIILGYYKFVAWPLFEFNRKIRWIFSPRFPRWRKLLLNHTNFDVTELAVETNFALIRDFYWEEVVDGVVDWNDNEEHKQFYDELVSAVNWIEKERANLSNQIREAYAKSSQVRVKTNERFDYYATYDEPIRLEKLKNDKEEEILRWLITNRQYFWT